MSDKVMNDLISSFKTTTLAQKVFIQMLDNNCHHSFMNLLSRWNKYETYIVLDEDFERFMWTAEHVAFPTHWALLSGIHDINPNHKKNKHWIEYK